MQALAKDNSDDDTIYSFVFIILDVCIYVIFYKEKIMIEQF